MMVRINDFYVDCGSTEIYTSGDDLYAYATISFSISDNNNGVFKGESEYTGTLVVNHNGEFYVINEVYDFMGNTHLLADYELIAIESTVMAYHMKDVDCLLGQINDSLDLLCA